MTRRRNYHRRGMTLVELTVVLVILSLLAVTVIPIINRSPNKSLLRDAAATVQGHIAQGISKAIGSRTGYGVWFDFDLTGTSTGMSMATSLAFCPGMTTNPGASQLTTAGLSATTATLSPAVPTSILGGTGSSFPAGTLISFLGFPYEYQLDGAGSTASFRSDAMQTNSNTTFPYNSGSGGSPNPTYSWVVSVPPTRTLGMKSTLGGNACIDLGCSSIGVSGYSNLAADVPTSPLRITFDSTGQGRTAVYAPLGGSQKVRRLDPETPIALLIGMADQVGNAWVASPSEDDPGSNLQRADAFWVVYDPRTSTSFIVENYVQSSAPPSTAVGIANAQTFVRQTLLNRLNAN